MLDIRCERLITSLAFVDEVQDLLKDKVVRLWVSEDLAAFHIQEGRNRLDLESLTEVLSL